MPNSFDALIDVPGGWPDRSSTTGSTPCAERGLDVSRLPFSLKVLLENLLRHEDGVTVTADDIKGLAAWDPKAEPDREIAFRPSRVLAPGLHRRAGDRRPGRHARRDEAAGRRPHARSTRSSRSSW